MKYGFQKLPIDIEKDHLFGSSRSIGGEVLQPDGDWTAFLPEDEFQNLNDIEPYACTSFGTLNAVETLANRLGIKENWSDRFLAKISGTDINHGNNPHTVAEYLRKQGTTLQGLWDVTPDINTFDKYYSEIPESIKTMGLQFVAEYSFGHEYVNSSLASLKEALKYSPLGISVYAWQMGQDGIYFKPKGCVDIHWCMLYKIEGDVGYIYDSYDNTHKKYRLSNVEVAKRYTLVKNTKDTLEAKKGWLDFLVNLVKTAFSPNLGEYPPKLYTVAKKYLGTHCTLDNTVDKSVGCAQVVSFLLKEAGYNIPKKGISSTIELYDWLSENFAKDLEPKLGGITISKTIGNKHGHVGVNMRDGIASNSSPTGLLELNYSYDYWKTSFGNKGLETDYFSPIC